MLEHISRALIRRRINRNDIAVLAEAVIRATRRSLTVTEPKPISRRLFALFALSLPRGPNFEPLEEVSWWQDEHGTAIGVVTFNSADRTFGCQSLRRDVDHCFRSFAPASGLMSAEQALERLKQDMKCGQAPEPRRNGVPARPHPFHLVEGRVLNEKFSLLRDMLSHRSAALAVGEVYFALHRPDENFVGDFQTAGFEARLWELYLFAAFREQAIEVYQDFPSPDFRLVNHNKTVFVEAVTANAEDRMQPAFVPRVSPPEDRTEQLIGEPAARFAKSLRSKMLRRYWELANVRGYPFVLAIADFHKSGSMTWSLHALQSYLYGSMVESAEENGERRTWSVPVERLRDKHGIPAGFFTQPDGEHLSAVIGCNAATLGKFNRMGRLAGYKIPGQRMKRSGLIFNHDGNRLEPIKFRYDIDDPAYENLWPGGEAWCLEMEVYHNPKALHPIARDFFLEQLTSSSAMAKSSS